MGGVCLGSPLRRSRLRAAGLPHAQALPRGRCRGARCCVGTGRCWALLGTGLVAGGWCRALRRVALCGEAPCHGAVTWHGARSCPLAPTWGELGGTAGMGKPEGQESLPALRFPALKQVGVVQGDARNPPCPLLRQP